MKLFGAQTQNIEANLRYIIVPLSGVLVVSILIIYAIKTGLTQIPKMFDELRAEQQNNNLLSEKLNILEKFRSGVLSQSDSSIYALPDNDSLLWFLSLLKNTALNNEVAIEGLDFKRSNNGDLNSITYSLQVDALDRKNILSYIIDIKASAPISSVDEIFVESGEGFVKSNLEITTYWKPLPNKIPALTQPITDLSTNEADVLQEAAKLRSPEFTTLEPEAKSDRTNPFY